MSASIKDVAARAGVAFQTVSKVLNGKGTVSENTRRRILSAAKDLNYVPNGLARGLRASTTLTLGVLADDFSNATPAESLGGISREAERHGLSVVVAPAGPDAEHARANLRRLTERRVDGLILLAPRLDADHDLARQIAAGPPAVALHNVKYRKVSRVTASSHAASLPIERLVALGHRRIAMIGGLRGRRITQARAAAYRRVLVKHGIDVDPALEDYSDWHVAGGRDAMHRILDRCPNATAAYVQNDLMAIGALRALHERGLRVPEDFSLIGCDDLAMSAHLVPSLSTVRIPFAEMGEIAVRTVMRHIAEPESEPESIVLPVELVDRESTGPCPSRTAQPSHGVYLSR